MLRNMFCHLPGIGTRTEQALWDAGIHSWDNVLRTPDVDLRGLTRKNLRRQIEPSRNEMAGGNARFSAEGLPAGQHWRLFPEFRDSDQYGNSLTSPHSNPVPETDKTIPKSVRFLQDRNRQANKPAAGRRFRLTAKLARLLLLYRETAAVRP